MTKYTFTRHDEIMAQIDTGLGQGHYDEPSRDCGIDIYYLVEYLRELEARVEALERGAKSE